jgi:hypothetical protein
MTRRGSTHAGRPSVLPAPGYAGPVVAPGGEAVSMGKDLVVSFHGEDGRQTLFCFAGLPLPGWHQALAGALAERTGPAGGLRTLASAGHCWTVMKRLVRFLASHPDAPAAPGGLTRAHMEAFLRHRAATTGSASAWGEVRSDQQPGVQRRARPGREDRDLGGRRTGRPGHHDARETPARGHRLAARSAALRSRSRARQPRPEPGPENGTTNRQLNELAFWISGYCREPGRGDGIPLVNGQPFRLLTRQFRRTLAWFIARQPGGVIAGAIQYRHLSIQMFEGYAKARELHQAGEKPQVARSARCLAGLRGVYIKVT